MNPEPKKPEPKILTVILPAVRFRLAFSLLGAILSVNLSVLLDNNMLIPAKITNSFAVFVQVKRPSKDAFERCLRFLFGSSNFVS